MYLDERRPEAPARAANARISLGYAAAAVVVAFIAAQLCGKLAGDVARAVTHAADNAMTAGVVVPSMLASELALLLVSLLVPLVAAKPVRESLGLTAASVPVVLVTGLGTVMLGPLGDRAMSAFSELFPGLTLGVIPSLHDLAQRLPLAWLWPSFALLPGMAEELLFRGVLQRSFERRALGIAVAGCAFALFHVDPVHVIGVLPLGLFLSWAAARSCTTVTIVAHVLNNSIAVLAIRNAELDMGFGSDQPLPTSWLVVSLVGFALCAAALHSLTRADQGTG
jgi:membrane protease YdiL (CAAX protease family)